MSEANWHRQMLADRQRVQAFGLAIREAVKPGGIVLDLGAGSGVLALLACQAGASRVYAIEQGHIIEVARQIARQNNLADKIVFIPGHSTKVELPERVDLIVSEIIGSFGLDEDILSVLADARKRFLKPDGLLLPDGLDLFLAPTEEGCQYQCWAGELQEDWGLEFSPLEELCAHATHTLWADPSRFLGFPAKLLTCDFYQDEPGRLQGEIQVKIERRGRLAGWIGWFAARHNGKVFLATTPPIKGSSWDNVFFPVGEPVKVGPGEVAGLKMHLDDPFWSWEFCLPPLARGFGDFYCYPPSVFKPSGKIRACQSHSR